MKEALSGENFDGRLKDAMIFIVFIFRIDISPPASADAPYSRRRGLQ
jgi:hypothetical protein